MRVAIYARVSTDDKGQDPENQLRGFELRASIRAIRFLASMSSMKADGKVRTGKSDSLRYSTTWQKEIRLCVVFGR